METEGGPEERPSTGQGGAGEDLQSACVPQGVQQQGGVQDTADTKEEYKTRCLADDPEGFELLFGPIESDVQLTGVKVDMVTDSAAERIMELPQYLELREDQVTEEG